MIFKRYLQFFLYQAKHNMGGTCRFFIFLATLLFFFFKQSETFPDSKIPRAKPFPKGGKITRLRDYPAWPWLGFSSLAKIIFEGRLHLYKIIRL